MKVATKKISLKIMPMLGASKWFIAAPLFFEGVLYGLIGSLLGWTVMYALLLYLTPWLKDFLGSINLLPVPTSVFAMQLSIGTLIAMTLGGLAGIFAVKRIIK
jgi:cell division protein FtsX